MEKYKSVIQQLTLNDATYHNQTITPTFINYFFGNNGVGKTTIGRTISANQGIVYPQGKTSCDYNILVYNQEFIEENIASYDNLQGVFTLDRQNIETAFKLKKLLQEKEKLDSEFKDNQTAIKEVKDKFNSDKALCCDTLWDLGKEARRTFMQSFTGFRSKKEQFFTKLISTPYHKPHNEDELTLLYETAYNPHAQKYILINRVNTPKVLDDFKNIGLLDEPIVGAQSSAFADFVSVLNASDWIISGHDSYSHLADGKCPYCQQQLPSNFEQKLSECFDQQYNDKIDKLDALLLNYGNRSEAILNSTQFSQRLTSPLFDLELYNAKRAIIKSIIDKNVSIIKQKNDNPSKVFSIEPLAPYFEELNTMIDGINTLISRNNEIVDSLSEKKKECDVKVWEQLASEVSSQIIAWKKVTTQYEKTIESLNEQENTLKRKLAELALEIAKTNDELINTEAAVENINLLLKDSGFQGFSLIKKDQNTNTYAVIRENGLPAKRLSEGERNFIAFLYFYYKVLSSGNEAEGLKDKIVVIDDPVSSMDSSSLFIVSSLVRKLIAICQNNANPEEDVEQGSYIKQIFILTHNTYFFKEVSNSMERHFKFCSFYLITKNNNVSSIKLCVRNKENAPSQPENYSPVQNSYAAIWTEYKELNSIIPLLNVMRRILEYYFIQMCGYDGVSVQKRILEDKRRNFIKFDSNGNEDTTNLQIASSLLSYINASSIGVNSGIYFVDSCCDVEECKATFKLIFECMHQEQHYHMMMGEEN